MYAYLDNSATTKCSDAVIKKVNEMMKKNYGNPSSMHNVGFEAEKVVKAARKTMADSLKVDEKEIARMSERLLENN